MERLRQGGVSLRSAAGMAGGGRNHKLQPALLPLATAANKRPVSPPLPYLQFLFRVNLHFPPTIMSGIENALVDGSPLASPIASVSGVEPLDIAARRAAAIKGPNGVYVSLSQVVILGQSI